MLAVEKQVVEGSLQLILLPHIMKQNTALQTLGLQALLKIFLILRGSQLSLAEHITDLLLCLLLHLVP